MGPPAVPLQDVRRGSGEEKKQRERARGSGVGDGSILFVVHFFLLLYCRLALLRRTRTPIAHLDIIVAVRYSLRSATRPFLAMPSIVLNTRYRPRVPESVPRSLMLFDFWLFCVVLRVDFGLIRSVAKKK